MVKLMIFLKPYRFQIFLVLLLLLVQALSELLLPALMSDIVDVGIVNGDTGYILHKGFTMLAAAAVGTLCALTAGFFSSRISMGFSGDLRLRVFTKVGNFSLNEFDRIGTSSLITRTTNDIAQIQHVTVAGLRMIISAPLMIIGGVIMAVAKDPGLSLSLVFTVPLIILAIVLIARKGMPLFRMIQDKIDNLNRVFRENLTGIRVIRAFNREEQEQRRFDRANRDLTEISIRVNRIMAVMMPVMMLIMNLAVVAVIWFGSLRINEGALEVGDLMAFIQYVSRILFSFLMLSMMFIMIPRAAVSAGRINEVLETRPEIQDPPDAQTPDNRSPAVLEFRNVSFRYPGAEEPALKNISFTAEPGKITAVIGGTGSGKSTLVNLIPRFYDVSSGHILLGGVDIRKMNQKDLRAKMGLVPQKALLFGGTVRENIRYGDPRALDEDIREALKISQAEDFVKDLENGLDAEIAQGGANLSGGQKQRIAIARALVRKPEIHLFDDSFSALDFKTEANLRKALETSAGDAAVLIVTQRVSNIMNAHQILVLDEGRLAGRGTHRELLDSCPVYREIACSQLSSEELQ